MYPIQNNLSNTISIYQIPSRTTLKCWFSSTNLLFVMESPLTKTFGFRSTDQILLSYIVLLLQMVYSVIEQVSSLPSMARVALFSKVLDWVVDLPKAALEIFPIRKKEKHHQCYILNYWCKNHLRQVGPNLKLVHVLLYNIFLCYFGMISR